MVKPDINSFNNLVNGYLKNKSSIFATVEANNIAIRKKIVLDSPNLNYLFGGGISYTRPHQIYGPEHAGKTSLVAAIAGCVQRKMNEMTPGKNKVIWMDFERTFDPTYAEKLGLDVSPENFYLMQADTGEEGFEIVEALIKTGSVAVVVLDSDASMPVASELNTNEVGKATFGAQARLLSPVIRQINILCANYDTLYYEISQERPDPTIRTSYGVVKKATGGEAIKFYATTRNRIKKIEEIRNSDGEATGLRVCVTNIKNKQGGGAKPWRKVELVLSFTKGFDAEAEYVDMICKLANDLPDLSHPNNRTYLSETLGFKCTSRGQFEEFLVDEKNKEIFNKLKSEVDLFFTKGSSLDAQNIEVREDDDGIEIQTQEDIIKDRILREKEKETGFGEEVQDLKVPD